VLKNGLSVGIETFLFSEITVSLSGYRADFYVTAVVSERLEKLHVITF
jgi:hypothetical protein